MDNELKQYLEAMEHRMESMEHRMEAMEQRLVARIDESGKALEQRIDESTKALEERLVERIRDSETTLLTEFHKWASPLDLRMRTHAAAIKALDAETEYLSDRVKKLEDRPTGT
jgi:DNA anti-recombination protein RmuC